MAAANHARNLPLPVSDPRAPLRRFAPPAASQPASPAELPAAPAADARPAEATLAIVGLNPSKAPDFPTPPGSRQAGFSGGPQPRKQGGEGPAEDGAVVVPWLTARGGAKDAQPTLVANPDPMARENLIAAARNAVPNPPPDPAMPTATRVSSAPDPRLEGRAVYSHRHPDAQRHQLLRKLDRVVRRTRARARRPAARGARARAAAQGRPQVRRGSRPGPRRRLGPPVRRHPHRTATWNPFDSCGTSTTASTAAPQEALAKWIFEPALRNGTPMDVEAVFEIPFHLAPRPAR